MIIYQAIMIAESSVGNGKCPYLSGNESGVACSLVKAFPTVKPYVRAVLEAEVSMADVKGILCDIASGNGCPVQPDLAERGPRSIYAKPT